MTIDEYCDEYVKVDAETQGEITGEQYTFLTDLEAEIVERFKSLTAVEHKWLLSHLDDGPRSFFVSLVLNGTEKIGEDFFQPLIRAGVYEVDPSLNRRFIEPAVKHFGNRRVKEALLEFIDKGDTFEQAGAINAIYWAGMKVEFPPDVPIFSIEYATPESRASYESLADIRNRQ